MFAEIPWLLPETLSKKHSRVRRRWYNWRGEFYCTFANAALLAWWKYWKVTRAKIESVFKLRSTLLFVNIYIKIWNCCSPQICKDFYSVDRFWSGICCCQCQTLTAGNHSPGTMHARLLIYQGLIISVTSRVTLGISINWLPTTLFFIGNIWLTFRGQKKDPAKVQNTVTALM